MNRRQRFESESALRNAVAHERVTTSPLPPTSFKRLATMSDFTFEGGRCLTLTPRHHPGATHLTYVHGGGHVSDMTPYHWRLLHQLMARTGCTVHVPLYPLSPEHDHRPAHAMLQAWYAQQIHTHGANHCVWMGDSSGGGLAMAITQHAVANGLVCVRDLILISPWLDLSHDDPALPALASQDPWLDVPGMVAAARWWAGGDDVRAPHLSPAHGRLAGLKRLTLFMGTRDLLHPACVRLHQRALAEGLDSTLHEGQGLIHVWPLLPLAAAQTAIDHMVQRLQCPSAHEPV